MREQAAQRVGAFSRYNAAPPSLYPNQAAPYGSFPYADPTPPIWDSSQKRLRQDVPADPKYQGWDFNQEPIADTSAISNVPFAGLQTVSGTQSMEDILANAQKSQGVKTDIQNLIEMYGDPSTEVTDDPYAAPVSDPNIVTSGPLVPDQSRWDMLPAVPGTGDAIPMPNMEVNQPLDTGIIPASAQVGTNAFGIPDRTYGPTTETVPVADPNSYPSMDGPYGYVTDPSTILDIAQSVPDPVFLPPVTDFIAEVPSSDVTIDVAPSMSGVDYSQALADVGVEPTSAGMAPVTMATQTSLPGRTPQAQVAEVPEISIPDRFIEDEKRDWETQEENDARNKEIIRDRKDVMRHLDVVYGTNYSGSMVGPVYGDWRGTVLGNLTREQVINLPDWARDSLLSIHDNVQRTEFLSNFVDTGTTQENIQDIINNKVAINLRDQGFDYNTALNSMNIATKDSVLAAAQMVEDGTIDLAESLPEMISQVDTFKDITTPAPTVTVSKDKQRKDLKAAAAAQRKADLAAQKAAAKAKRDLDKLKAKQTAADKNRIAAAAQEATRRSLEKQMQGWLGRDERDESAMAQIQAALDHIADLQGTGVTSGSTGDRSGEVRDAMRSVGYGGPEWT